MGQREVAIHAAIEEFLKSTYYCDDSYASWCSQGHVNMSNKSVLIYNEYSLQHELGIFLRGRFPGMQVEFERNISYFGMDKNSYLDSHGDPFLKSEMDIVIYDREEKYEIELKFPLNGEYPVTMYDCLKDIKFGEQLIEYKGKSDRDRFDAVFAVTVSADMRYFLKTKRSQDNPKYHSLYDIFRNIGTPIQGTIQSPKSQQSGSELKFDNIYKLEWHKPDGLILKDCDKSKIEGTYTVKNRKNTCLPFYYIVTVH